MTVYRIFDVSISCAFPIPGLPVLEQDIADWQVSLSNEALKEGEIEWFHHWQTPAGDKVMSCGRLGQAYFLRFIGLACFSIDFN